MPYYDENGNAIDESQLNEDAETEEDEEDSTSDDDQEIEWDGKYTPE